MATISVPAGSTIRSVLNGANSGDIINLAAGVHTITSTGSIGASNVTVNGVPGSTIIRQSNNAQYGITTDNIVHTGILFEAVSYIAGKDIDIQTGADNGRFTNCRFTNHFNGIRCQNKGIGWVFEDCLFFDIGRIEIESSNPGVYTILNHALYLTGACTNTTIRRCRFSRVRGGYNIHNYNPGGTTTVTQCLSWNSYFGVANSEGAGASASVVNVSNSAEAWVNAERPPEFPGPQNWPIKPVGGTVSGSGTYTMTDCVAYSNGSGGGGATGTGIGGSVTQTRVVVADAQFRAPIANGWLGGDFTIDNSAVHTGLGFGGIDAAGTLIPLGGTRPPKPPAPLAVAGFVAPNTPYVDVSWSAIPSATSYAVYVTRFGTQTELRFTTTALNYRFEPGLAGRGQTFLVRLAAINAIGEGLKSNYGSATCVGPNPPATPVITSVSTSVQGSVRYLVVAWTAGANAPHVFYWVWLNGAATPTLVTTKYAFIGPLNQGNPYAMQVLAYDAQIGKGSPLSAPFVGIVA